MFNFFRSKCVLCGKSGVDIVLKAEYHGHYSSTRTWKYHQQCLNLVLGNPEQFDNLTVDKAIEITECIIEQKNRAQAQVERERLHREEKLEQVGELKLKYLGTPNIDAD